MKKQELAKLRFQLVTAVTDYDRKQSTKPSYNIYALPQYFARIDEILSDVEAGTDPRSAIAAGFTGTLLNFVFRRMSEEKMSFPEPKQRIAVCLSKSRARRNPLLESGADISDDSDVNRQAKKMG